MGKASFILVFLNLACAVAFGQQFEQYSLFSLNKYAYNPAYSGMDEGLQVTAIHRAQWTGLDGAPTTSHINAHLPVYAVSGGFGMAFTTEKIGAWQRWSAGASWAQHVAIGKDAVVSAAIDGRVTQRSLDGQALRAPEGVYDGTTFEHNDILLSENMQTGTALSAGLGVYLRWKEFEAGAAVAHLNKPTFGRPDQDSLAFREVPHQFFHVGYTIRTGDVLEINPFVQHRSDGVKSQTEFSLQLTYAGTFFAGGGVRGWNDGTRDAGLLFGGIRLAPNVTLAYCHDVPLSDLRRANDGSHEILLKWSLGASVGKGHPPRILYHPRFL